MKRYFSVWFLILLLALVGLNLTCRRSMTEASIIESKEVITTYPFSDPDPVPILVKAGKERQRSRIYPYFFFDGFTNNSIEKKWTVVRMENPYIEVSMLPEVGGKVWGAREKSTGNEFIYTNHVLKFREIALRGPWTSGGIEFNFGLVGHAPSGATPVDYTLRKNADGSVSCFVGAMDLPSRTRWSVKVTLPAEKAFFETQAFWYNATPLHQSYYSWMNGAVRAQEDFQIILPGKFHIAHNFDVPLKPWPKDNLGRDLSWYKNNDFGSYKSYFTVGEFEDFYGGYWHNSRFGFGHWALYEDMPGQKVWLWGLSRQGMIWEDLLTDTDGQYSEPQSGRFFNQNDHEFLLPHVGEGWREIWFPYKDTGPMKKASPFGVLNVTPSADALNVSFCPLQKIDDDLVVSEKGKELFRKHLMLEPMEVFTEVLPIAESRGKIDIRIGDKISYTNDQYANDILRPIRFHSSYEKTVEGLYLTADRYNKEREYDLALQLYLDCLQQEPLHTRALSRVAELYFKRAEYDVALNYARKALENVMYDPDANYIYGIISRRMGNFVDALETLGWAARSLKFRSAAYLQMAEIYLVERKFDLAWEYAERALDYNRFNVNAYQVLAVINRILDRPEKGSEILNKILEFDPLNHFIRFEQYLLSSDPADLEQFQSMIRTELPFEIYLELAIYYWSLDMLSESSKLLKLAPESSMTRFWLAYILRETDPEESEKFLDQAESLSPLLVFPSRTESIPVLQWAIKSLPESWKTRYYLGLIFWSKGRKSDALDLFESCGSPDFYPFYLARNFLYRDEDENRALEDLHAAVEKSEDSWRAWHHLILYSLELNMDSEALSAAREAIQRLSDFTLIQIDLARALIANQLFSEAAEILDKIEIIPYEGARDVHSLFVTCQIELAFEKIREGDFLQAISLLDKSKTYPERLGSGKPYDPDLRKQDFFRALCYEKLGDSEIAEEIRKAIYNYTEQLKNSQGRYPYYGGLILEYYGEKNKADTFLQRYSPSETESEILVLLKK